MCAGAVGQTAKRCKGLKDVRERGKPTSSIFFVNFWPLPSTCGKRCPATGSPYQKHTISSSNKQLEKNAMPTHLTEKNHSWHVCIGSPYGHIDLVQASNGSVGSEVNLCKSQRRTGVPKTSHSKTSEELIQSSVRTVLVLEREVGEYREKRE